MSIWIVFRKYKQCSLTSDTTCGYDEHPYWSCCIKVVYGWVCISRTAAPGTSFFSLWRHYGHWFALKIWLEKHKHHFLQEVDTHTHIYILNAYIWLCLAAAPAHFLSIAVTANSQQRLAARNTERKVKGERV